MVADATQTPIFDLNRQKIGVTYAKALLEASESAGAVDEVLAQLGSLVHDLIAKHPGLREAFASRLILHEERVVVLDKAFAGKMHPTLLNFLKVVSRRDRQDCLFEIEAAAVRLRNEQLGLVAVLAKSAEPLSANSIARITEQLEAQLGQKVVLSTKVDPELIGGLVLQINDTVIDGSIANRLRRLRRETLDTAARQAREAMSRFTSS